MKILITGVAGFIGSTLAEKLIEDGYDITGIDNFNSYYSSITKKSNIRSLLLSKKFHLIDSDLFTIDKPIFDGVEIVFHLAGQPGVRSSWGKDFKGYVYNNIQVTQNILEIIKDSSSLKKFVFASSSSVYGNSQELPLKETATPKPVSPYGVTKLTAENLCSLYSFNYDIPMVCLRYFTVYGPRQRPDMAFHRFFKAHLAQEGITVFGDGTQTRDFTYVDDIIKGTISSAFSSYDEKAAIINLGSGKRILLNQVIEIIGEITGEELKIKYEMFEKGDMNDTLADITRARDMLDYSPSISLYDGLKEEYSWICSNKDMLL